MIKILIAASIIIPLNVGAADFDKQSANINIYGKITRQTVELLQKSSATPPRTITINSSGGDMEAAMKIGEWIHSNDINIIVNGVCASACADYIFPAGKHKKIEPESIVIWHGDLDQKNIRDSQSKYEHVLQTLDLSPDDKEAKDFINKNKSRYEYIKNLREQQNRLYERLGINGYIARIGQEPNNFGGHDWTTTVHVMNKFGINNISAPENYGTPSYLSSIRNGLYANEVISVITDGDNTIQLNNP